MRFVPVFILPLVGACSLIDALQGDDRPIDDPCVFDPDIPGCENFQFTCDSPLRVDVGFDGGVGVDMCGQDPSEPPDSCSGASGADAVFKIEIAEPGDYALCTTGPGDSTFSLSPDCRGTGSELCLLTNDCIVQFLPQGRQFVRWRAGDFEPCGFIEIFVEPPDTTFEEGQFCFDGKDNDSNGLTDCEDDSCRFDGVCESGISPEECDGFDDGDVLGAGVELIDEAACLCVDDSGCDHIDLDSQLPFVCHTNFDPDGSGVGVCAPTCGTTFNWCEQFGAVCVGGRCQF